MTSCEDRTRLSRLSKFVLKTIFFSNSILFQIKSLKGSADFFGLNHYTTFLMSPSSMEKEWKVPSMDHDTAVKMDQNPDWPMPGAAWLTVKCTLRNA